MKATDDFWRDQFQRIGEESLNWFLKALELNGAADLLAPVALDDLSHIFDRVRAQESPLVRRPVTGPYMLLAGLSIETLAKAILIDRKPSRVHDGVLDPWPGGAHRIPEVCRAVGIPWTSEERDLFHRLSDEVRWVGRYPIPNKEHHLLQRVNRLGGAGSNMRETDPALIHQVFETLWTVLDEEWLAARPERAADWRVRLVAEGLGQCPPSGDTRYNRGLKTIVMSWSSTARS